MRARTDTAVMAATLFAAAVGAGGAVLAAGLGACAHGPVARAPEAAAGGATTVPGRGAASEPPAGAGGGAAVAVDGPMSDPAEYAIDHVSRAAGEAIFVRTGIGDPYRTGVPYPMFLALMKAYPDLFGDDAQALARRFGMIARPADPSSKDPDVRAGLPLGMHLTTDPFTGVAFVVNSCALCHAARLRWPGGEATVIGLGNKTIRIHAYDAAFADAAARKDFDVARLAALADQEAKAHGAAWPLDWREPLARATVDAMRKRARARGPMLARLRDDPPGRVAPIESFAFALGALLGRDVATAPTVGWSKIPDVVGFADRVTLSWDGVGEGPMDVLVVEADVAAGVRPAWFWRHPLQGAALGAYLRQPRRHLPFPGPIDRALAARGKALFAAHCTPCHGTYGDDGRAIAYDEQVVPLEVVGTDPARANAPTDAFLAAANDPSLTRGLTRSRRTGGYVPPVLTGVWARAPFGHAGQWPSLAVMATPPDRRPTRFVLELDAPYDLAAVGVATRAPAAGAAPAALGPGEYLEDATRPGLGVEGHPFLAALGPDARAVIEYLKTL